MFERFTASFDQSATSPGAYYVTGDLVVHGPHEQICVVTDVKRLRGTKMTAYLEAVDNPTAEQTEQAERWVRRALGLPD